MLMNFQNTENRWIVGKPQPQEETGEGEIQFPSWTSNKFQAWFSRVKRQEYEVGPHLGINCRSAMEEPDPSAHSFSLAFPHLCIYGAAAIHRPQPKRCSEEVKQAAWKEAGFGCEWVCSIANPSSSWQMMATLPVTPGDRRLTLNSARSSRTTLHSAGRSVEETHYASAEEICTSY